MECALENNPDFGVEDPAVDDANVLALQFEVRALRPESGMQHSEIARATTSSGSLEMKVRKRFNSEIDRSNGVSRDGLCCRDVLVDEFPRDCKPDMMLPKLVELLDRRKSELGPPVMKKSSQSSVDWSNTVV